MPFRLNPKNRRCVQIERASGWERLKCHPSQARAKAHLSALLINVGESERLTEQTAPPFSMSKLLGNVNGRLLDAFLRHRHFVLNAENGVLADLVKSLDAAEKTIQAELRRIAGLQDAVSDFGRMRRGALQDLEALIGRALQQANGEIQGIARDRFAEFAMREWQVQAGIAERIIPTGISFDLAGGDLSRALAIVSEPLGGKFWTERLNGDFADLEAAMRRSLATSFALGEGIGDAVRRLATDTEKIGRNRLALIARTEMQRIANRAAMDSYQANKDVVKAVQIIETLDSRTCIVCATLDGQVRTVDSGDVPPFHPQCRGFVTPVVKSLAEMGLDPERFPPSVRAVLDGELSDRVLYPEWFAAQSDAFKLDVLGPARFERYRTGGLRLDDMVKNLRILPLDELPTRSLRP